MDIILKQDITGVGYKNDLLTVKDGFARNYLIPKGMAIIATDSSRKVLAESKKQQAFKLEKIKTAADTLATALEGTELKIAVKAGTSGKIFGSVNNIIIAAAIKEQKNLDIDRKLIFLDEEHIKDTGAHTAVIKLHKDVEVTLKLDVVAE